MVGCIEPEGALDSFSGVSWTVLVTVEGSGSGLAVIVDNSVEVITGVGLSVTVDIDTVVTT